MASAVFRSSPASFFAKLEETPLMMDDASTSSASASAVAAAAAAASALLAAGSPRCVACNSVERVSIHYNALSCHGCKAFFRRTVFERRKYYCSAEGRCEITDENRNQCRACRFQKCMKGGMNPKHVREERAKRRPMSDSEHESSFLDQSPNASCSVAGPLPDELPITSALVELEARLDRCEYADAEHAVQLRKQIVEQYGIPNVNMNDTNFRCESILNEAELTDVYHRVFLLLSEWAGGVAEFRMLSSEDQMLLFRQNFMIFGWLHYAYKALPYGAECPGIPLGNGSYLPYRAHERALMSPRYQQTYGHIGVKLVEMIVAPMHEMAVDMEEYVLLKGMALFQTDNQLSPEGARLAAQVRDVLLSALITHIDRRFPQMSASQKSQRSVKLTLLFPSLMAIGHLEATYVQKLAAEMSSSTSGDRASHDASAPVDDTLMDTTPPVASGSFDLSPPPVTTTTASFPSYVLANLKTSPLASPPPPAHTLAIPVSSYGAALPSASQPMMPVVSASEGLVSSSLPVSMSLDAAVAQQLLRNCLSQCNVFFDVTQMQ